MKNEFISLIGGVVLLFSSAADADCSDFFISGETLMGSLIATSGATYSPKLSIHQAYACQSGTCFNGFISFDRENITDRIFGSYRGLEFKFTRKCSACTISGGQIYDGACVGRTAKGTYADGGGSYHAGSFKFR